MTNRDGQRAINWWWYTHSAHSGSAGIPQATNQGYRGDPDAERNGWTVRVSRPRKPYGMSTDPRGRQRRKTHIVRDVLIATHRLHGEVRMTRWLCGAYSWSGELLWHTPAVCSACLSRQLGRTIERNTIRWDRETIGRA